MSKTFAPEYKQNEEGLYLFPRDDQYRKELFPLLVLSEHPAKANIFMVQALIEYLTEPEQTIMDIMAGTGTIMTAALIGRRVVCIEIEDDYQKILQQSLGSLEAIAPGISSQVTIIPGNCEHLLPLPIADHIIFSPPYAGIMKKKKLDKLSAEMMGDGLLKYSKHPRNVGNLNEFLYNQTMEKIYRKCFDSLPTGGTMTVIIKDHIRQGKRMYLGDWVLRSCSKKGFQLKNWFRWLPPGSAYSSFMKARGDLVVDEEDLIILEKGGVK